MDGPITRSATNLNPMPMQGQRFQMQLALGVTPRQLLRIWFSHSTTRFLRLPRVRVQPVRVLAAKCKQERNIKLLRN